MSDLLNGWDEDGEPMTKLSDRIRPDCEAAPWVCREIKELEKRIAELAPYRKAIMQIHEQRHGFADATSAIGWIYDRVDEALGADDD